MDSVKADEGGLTKHLKSADFFDVAKFPKATITSTEIKPGGEKGATHTVTGNLELHGVRKSITFPATITVTGDAATMQSEFDSGSFPAKPPENNSRYRTQTTRRRVRPSRESPLRISRASSISNSRPPASDRDM